MSKEIIRPFRTSFIVLEESPNFHALYTYYESKRTYGAYAALHERIQLWHISTTRPLPVIVGMHILYQCNAASKNLETRAVFDVDKGLAEKIYKLINAMPEEVAKEIIDDPASILPPTYRVKPSIPQNDTHIYPQDLLKHWKEHGDDFWHYITGDVK
jgi:hypothetical protein